MALFKLIDLALLIPAAIISALLNIRYALSTHFIEGLMQYIPTSSSTIAAASGAATTATTTTNRKKNNKSKDSVGLGDAENLMIYGIPGSQVESTLFFPILDSMVYSAQLAVLTCIAYPAVAHLFLELEKNQDATSTTSSSSTFASFASTASSFLPTPVVLASGVAFMSLTSLARVDFLSNYSSGADKGYVLIFGFFGFIAAAALFALEPKGAFAWSADDGAAAIGSLLEQVSRKTAPGVPIQDAIAALTPSPAVLRGALSFLATIISGLFLASALRFVRAYRLQQEPPSWSVGQLQQLTWFSSLKLNLLLALPAVSSLSWTGPLFKDAFGLTEEQAAGIRALLALTTGVMFLSTCKLVLQRYMDTALIAWHTYKHGARRSSTERAAASEMIQLNAAAVRKLVGKAAVQVVAPGVFYLCVGLALGTLWLHPAAGAVGASGAANAESAAVLRDTQRLVSCVAGFCIWWAGIAWVVYCGVALWLYRTGTLN